MIIYDDNEVIIDSINKTYVISIIMQILVVYICSSINISSIYKYIYVILIIIYVSDYHDIYTI